MFIEDVFHDIYAGKITFDQLINPTEEQVYSLLQTLKIKSKNFMVVIDELLINSQEHGGSPIDFYYGESLDFLFFAIVDKGPGIHITLPRNEKLSDIKNKSSTAIIRLSVEEGITGTSTPGRGMGLSLLSKFVADKNAEALVACNSGLLRQMGSYFIEKKLSYDIVGNCIVIKILKKELGI